MPTLREYAADSYRRLGGYESGTTSALPDINTDPDAQRVLVAASLYDSDQDVLPDRFAADYAWIPEDLDSRRVRNDGFENEHKLLLTPPSSGTYTLTFHGLGTTSSLNFNASTATIQTAIRATHGDLAGSTVSGSSTPYAIGLDRADVGCSITVGGGGSGGSVTSAGLGRVLVSRPFARVLPAGTAWEILPLLPRKRLDKLPGMNELVNLALARLWFVHRHPLTPTEDGQRVFDLSSETWLARRQQAIALDHPAEYEWAGTLTPPAGSFTLTLDLGPEGGTVGTFTGATVTGQQIQDALRLLTGAEAAVVSPLTTSASFAISLPLTRYWRPTLSTTGGTVASPFPTMVRPAYRAAATWSLQYDGARPFLETEGGWAEGDTLYLSAYRRADGWICPQVDWDTPGPETAWATSSTGLIGDADRAIPPVEEVGAVAYYLACQQLAAMAPASEVKEWQRRMRDAAIIAAQIKLFDLPLDPKPGRWGSPRGARLTKDDLI
jgi:hypothetical protein